MTGSSTAVRQSSDRTRLTLRHPIQVGTERLAELEFGAPDDIRELPELSDELLVDDLILVAARMTGQPTEVIEQIDMDDVADVIAVTMGHYRRYRRDASLRARCRPPTMRYAAPPWRCRPRQRRSHRAVAKATASSSSGDDPPLEPPPNRRRLTAEVAP